MMQEPDRQEIEAMNVLNGNQAFTVFRGWLRRSLQYTREQNDGLRGDDLKESQGRAQNMNEILKQIENAEETNRNMRVAQGATSR